MTAFALAILMLIMDQISEMPDEPLKGLTLLLADDEARLRQVVGLMAEELGAEVIVVDNNEEAIQIYTERRD